MTNGGTDGSADVHRSRRPLVVDAADNRAVSREIDSPAWEPDTVVAFEQFLDRGARCCNRRPCEARSAARDPDAPRPETGAAPAAP